MNVLHFQKKKKISRLCQNEWKLRRKLAIAESRMKCKEVNRPKYECEWQPSKFCTLISDIIKWNWLTQWFIACMLSDAHIWAIMISIRDAFAIVIAVDNIAHIYFSSFRNRILIFFLFFACFWFPAHEIIESSGRSVCNKQTNTQPHYSEWDSMIFKRIDFVVYCVPGYECVANDAD